MRKTALLLAVAMALAAPSMAFAKKARHHARRAAPEQQQTFESLNRDSLHAIHDMFFFWVPSN